VLNAAVEDDELDCDEADCDEADCDDDDADDRDDTDVVERDEDEADDAVRLLNDDVLGIFLNPFDVASVPKNIRRTAV
jgi:hypothetical protein